MEITTMSTSTDLRQRKCEPCEGHVKPLSTDEARKLAEHVPDWKLTGQRLRREWCMKDFPAAIDFFRRVGDLAEAEGHHPDLHLVSYRELAIEIWTHAVNGLTENDFILAAKIDELPVDLKV
jgi:4a-hydroxytetrahydrobiopterin dehydratase